MRIIIIKGKFIEDHVPFVQNRQDNFFFFLSRIDILNFTILHISRVRKVLMTGAVRIKTLLSSRQYKPVSTRKLRRRGNEPPPLVEKRRKPMANSLQLLLEEKDIEDDLKMINKSKLVTVKKSCKRFSAFLSSINHVR